MKKTLITTLTFATLLEVLGCKYAPVGDTNNAEIRELNAGLSEMSGRCGFEFIDTYYLFMDDNGQPMTVYYMDDGEHLSEMGYRRWARGRLIPYLSKHLDYQKVAMVGDSITARVAVVPSPDGHETTWSDLLSTDGRTISAINQGVDGDTTDDLEERLTSVVQPGIQCYFLMIGNNDLHQGVTVSETVQKVENVAQEMKNKSGCPVVIQAVMPLCY